MPISGLFPGLRAALHRIIPAFSSRSGGPSEHGSFFFSRSLRRPASQNRQAACRRLLSRVETLAHCARCHSSRNVVGAIIPETRFAGGIDPQGTGYVPNITAARIADWSEEDLVRMLTTGETLTMAGQFLNVRRRGEQLASESDHEAVARYDKTLGAIPRRDLGLSGYKDRRPGPWLRRDLCRTRRHRRSLSVLLWPNNPAPRVSRCWAGSRLCKRAATPTAPAQPDHRRQARQGSYDSQRNRNVEKWRVPGPSFPPVIKIAVSPISWRVLMRLTIRNDTASAVHRRHVSKAGVTRQPTHSILVLDCLIKPIGEKSRLPHRPCRRDPH